MNLYKISQKENTGYDTCDALIAAAETAEDARTILPHGSDWAAKPENVRVECLGEAASHIKRGIIFWSFNVG